MSGTVGRKPPRAVLWGKLAWHPAAAAWSAFAAGAAEPERIEVLRNGKKAGTYRLVGAGPAGESIIAQRSPVARALIERAVYERILPRLAVTAPHYYGSREDGRDFVWLFLEDLGDERFSKTDPVHAEHAARWVGTMHSGAAWISAARQDQSATRSATELLEYHEIAGRPILKVFPLARWSRADVWRYIRENGIPYHPLLDQGYTSIGCWPCTRPTAPGEPERAGRWSGTGKTECGLHTFTVKREADAVSGER